MSNDNVEVIWSSVRAQKAREIARLLQEPDEEVFVPVSKFFTAEELQQMYEETLEIERNGGRTYRWRRKDKRHTLGGVFFKQCKRQFSIALYGAQAGKKRKRTLSDMALAERSDMALAAASASDEVLSRS